MLAQKIKENLGMFPEQLLQGRFYVRGRQGLCTGCLRIPSDSMEKHPCGQYPGKNAFCSHMNEGNTITDGEDPESEESQSDDMPTVEESENVTDETVSGSVTFYSESGGDIVIATAGSQSSIREIHVTFSA